MPGPFPTIQFLDPNTPQREYSVYQYRFISVDGRVLHITGYTFPADVTAVLLAGRNVPKDGRVLHITG
jgi:hypothetical protein